MAEFDGKIVKLPHREEMRQRLYKETSLSSHAEAREKIFPMFLEHAGEEMTGNQVISLIVDSLSFYALEHIRDSRPIRRELFDEITVYIEPLIRGSAVERFLRVLVNDEEVLWETQRQTNLDRTIRKPESTSGRFAKT